MHIHLYVGKFQDYKAFTDNNYSVRTQYTMLRLSMPTYLRLSTYSLISFRTPSLRNKLSSVSVTLS
jgi:hypothetical protein